jgi:acyl-CoA thioesterase
MGEQSKAEQVVQSMMAQDRFSQWLGIEVLAVAKGSVKLQMTIKHDMLNGFGILHGGVIFALADSALAFASNGLGKISVSVEASMSFIKSAREGEVLTAIASEINAANRIAVYQVLVTNATGETLAHFKGTVYRTSKEHVT